MGRFCAVFILLCYSICYSSIGLAQSTSRFNAVKDDISTMIPPLSVLIDSAIANNAGLRSSNLQVLINKNSLQLKRNYWTRNFSLQADVRYGNFTNYTSDYATNIDISTTRGEFRYGVGGSLKFPINDLLDRRNQIKIAKTEIDHAQSIFEDRQSELRKTVIIHYNDLLLKQRLLKLSAKNMETVKITMQMVEKEFLNGIIPLTEYARVSGIVSGTEAEYENARTDFLTAVMILEEVVGMKFNLVNYIPGTNEPN